MIVDEESNLGWATVSHFYDGFYVYQYATGYGAAIAIVKQLQIGGSQARDKYLELLKAGESDYPIEILKKAGVDLSTPGPVREALEFFETLVDKMEEAFATPCPLCFSSTTTSQR